MNDTKKPTPPKPLPVSESTDFGEAALKQQNNRDHVLSVMQRVPITPTPTRPPDKDKND